MERGANEWTRIERLFAWFGAAMFVASLSLGGALYGLVWAHEHSFAGWTAVVADTALFSVFALHHSLFARAPGKRILAGLLPDRLLRPFYVWVASLLFIAVLLAWREVGGVVYRSSGALMFAHVTIQLLGVWLTAAAVRAIDPLELAGIRPKDMAGSLQTHGPYRLVRHPLYLGWMLIVFGAAHMTGDRFTFAVVSSVYLFIAVPWEERGLERTFGAEYARYTREVRWRIVPYVF